MTRKRIVNNIEWDRLHYGMVTVISDVRIYYEQ